MRFRVFQDTNAKQFRFYTLTRGEILAELSGAVIATEIAWALENVVIGGSNLGKHALESITAVFKNHIRQKEIEIHCFKNEKFKKSIELLDATGFDRLHKKILYKKDLKDLQKFTKEAFHLAPLPNIDRLDFQYTFYKSIEGDKYANLQNLPANLFLKYKINSAGDFYNPSIWFLAHLNDVPVGVLLCRVEKQSDFNTIGNFNYIGLIPKYRNQGLGTKLFVQGLKVLQNLGSTEYIGSTSSDNLPMQKVFQKNDCDKFAEQIVFV